MLYYPQKPLGTTKAMEFLKFRELPAGINAIVAIACYSGYNQEDSMMMNQSSLDRGLFRSIFFRTYKDEEQSKTSGMREMFERPGADAKGKKHGSYEKLDDDGLAPPGERLTGGFLYPRCFGLALARQLSHPQVPAFLARISSSARRLP